jgi:hypothetical protein
MIRRFLPLLAAGALSAQVLAPQPFQAANGLSCLLVESHERPLIRMELICRWDRSELPAGKEGIAGFLARAMEAGGAGIYSRAAFNRAVDALGMRFSFTPRMGAFRWTVATDSRAQEAAMDLLADAVARPAFDVPLVEGERQAMLKRASAESQRDRAVSRFLWGLGDPAALLPPGAVGLDRIEYQDLQDFRRRVLRPEHAALVLYGDLNLTQARQLVLMHLGVWGPGAQPPVKGNPPRTGARTVPEPRLLAVLESSAGAELWAGAPAPAPGGPAVAALLPILLDRSSRAVFGTLQMHFRIPAQGPLLIQAKAPQAGRDALVSGFTAGLERLRGTGFSPEDLARALVQWRAENLALGLHPEALLREDLDGQLDPALALAVDRLTLQDLNQALRAWLDPQRLRFLLLGADAPMVQAADKAGLKPSAILEPGN